MTVTRITTALFLASAATSTTIPQGPNGCQPCVDKFGSNEGCLAKDGAAFQAAFPQECKACYGDMVQSCQQALEECRPCAQAFSKAGGCKAIADSDGAKVTKTYADLPAGDGCDKCHDETTFFCGWEAEVEHCKKCGDSFVEKGGCAPLKTGDFDKVTAAIDQGCNMCQAASTLACVQKDCAQCITYLLPDSGRMRHQGRQGQPNDPSQPS